MTITHAHTLPPITLSWQCRGFLVLFKSRLILWYFLASPGFGSDRTIYLWN